MKLLRLGFVACAAAFALAAPGCAGGGSNGTGTAGSGGGSTGTAGATGTAGSSGSTGAAGTTGTAGAGGNSGAAGSAAGVAGMTGSGGTTGAAGSAGGTAGSAGASGTAGAGGAAAGSGGSSGSAGRGGSGGSAGGGAGRGGTGGTAGGGTAGSGGGTGGTGGGTTPHGSAAKFNCPAGPFASNPLTGMGTVNQIAAPNPDYFAFIEGPVWISSLSTLFFSDNASSPTERIWKLVPPSTTPTIFVAASGSNGLGVDNNNQIIATIQRSPYGIARFDPMTGTIGTKIATTAKPNDVIVRSDDNVYFTDPQTGFYRIAPGSSTVSAAMKLPNNSGQPNGIELSLDENTLYVGDVSGNAIYKFTLAADGSVGATGTMFAMAQSGHNTFDGMCVDCAGNVYVGTSGGVEAYTSTGTYIGTIPTGESSNCTFGGADRKTMYVTSRAVLKYVTLAVPGLPD